jgi:enterochelin esterase-like enzyme
MMLLWLILSLGVVACTTNEIPAATSAGFVNPDVSPDLSRTAPDPSPTNTSGPTKTTAPTQTSAPAPLVSVTPPPSTPLVCRDTSGRIEEHQLESELLDDPFEYLIYLPPCYDDQPRRSYPAIYLIHGQTYSNDHWIDLGAVEIADDFIASGELAPFIMVFPYDPDHYIPPTENRFGEAVISNLIPTIDQKYRTIPERAYRAIGGISRGGNWAIHIGLQNPTIFSAIGAHSTPVFSTDTNPEIVAWLRAISLEDLPRIFVDTGKNDRYRTFTLVFEEILNEEGIPHEWHLYPGFHEDEYWQAHLEEYLRWYAHSWSVENEE